MCLPMKPAAVDLTEPLFGLPVLLPRVNAIKGAVSR